MVNAFPNPSTNGWNIQTANQNITNVTLYDMAGKQVAVYTPETTAVKIAGDNLSAGIYIASVTTTEGSSTIKLIKK